MQNRERGAAHINIYYFLVLMVLFLGALWFGYVVLTQNNEMKRARLEAQKQEAQAKANLSLYVEYVRDMTSILGESGEYKSSKNLTVEIPGLEPGEVLKFEPTPIGKATLPASLKQRINVFSRSLEIPGAVSTPISSLFGQVTEVVDGLRTEKQNAEKRAETAEAALAQANQAYATDRSAANSRIAEANTRFQSQMSTVNAEHNRQVSRNTQQNNEIRRLGAQINDMRNQHQDTVSKLEKEKNLLQLTNEHLISLTRLINPPDAPDGAIISASMDARVAFVDIGRKDMLPLGTVFKITAPSLDGRSDGKLKALGTVTEVLQDRAKLKLFNVQDRFNPVVRGDVVVSELYSPHVKRNIALIGRFSYPYPKPEVKRLLERLGNKVVDKVGIDVDLVIVGNDTVNEEGGLDDITTSEEYKFAENQRIEIITLSKIRNLLKLSNE